MKRETSPDFSVSPQFDALPSVALGAPGPLPTPVDDLAFNGFNYKTDFVIQTSNSPKNAITSPQLIQLLKGLPPSNISAMYPDSKVKYFALTSAYVSCVVSSTGTLGAAGVPAPVVPLGEPCTVLFSGYNFKKQPISQRCSFSDTPVDPLKVGPQKCVFGSQFADAVVVILSVENALALPNTTTVYVDDVVHTNYHQ